MTCGFVAQTGSEFLAKTDYYEQRYVDYYRRPGTAVYDVHRYVAMANWMKDALGDFQPKTVLDVGCGAGSSMVEVKKAYTSAEIEGIEPSIENGGIARHRGFNVQTFKVGEGRSSEKKYDLIYSHNVFTHVNDPTAFLFGLKEMLADGGRIVQLTADSTTPSNELLWCDNNYSYLPIHLVKLAEKAGLVALRYEENPYDVTILNKQIVVFAKEGRADSTIEKLRAKKINVGELFNRRATYMADWMKTNNDLREEISAYSRVVNFGASMWTWLLAGCCPDYWSRVDFCTVEGFSGRCVDRDVIAFADVEWKRADCLVLGVNPLNQDKLKARFDEQPFHVITWNDRVRI